MSHITQADRGLKALDARKWDEALELLSKALLSSPNPAWLLARSKALINLKRYEEALDDAEAAFNAAFDRKKRELLIEAHYRRAVAHFRLGQYANGDCCSIYAMRLCKGFPAIEREDPKHQHIDENGFWTETLESAKLEAAEDTVNKTRDGREMPATMDSVKDSPLFNGWRRASTMRMQCLNAMGKLPADDPARKVTVSVKPEYKRLADLTKDRELENTGLELSSGVTKHRSESRTCKSLHVQDYQTNSVMNVSIFSKGVDKEKLRVEFLPDSVRLNPVIYPDGEEKEFVLRLYSEIDPSTSSFTVTPKKVEMQLTKKTAGRWPRLTIQEPVDQEAKNERQELEMESADEKSNSAASTSDHEDETARKDAANTSVGTKSAGPVYPTSSRTGPKDWDKITADDEKDEEAEGGVNDFFKKLYKNASDDQKRAMMKSFTESNGTSLSTDWLDVANRTVTTKPPEGVEAKEW
ncbi:hypothetical protein C2857_004246 [Epichloe festucae Fl1]|uniref:Uncharacterized protein n=1 Tax=Epichloe festucae (strain Fl1) TaxID=877507 RepID=A0A7S9KP36_EPIFF|nr:hypothetical protein C2857_004246 [Epichloe festucae Fl1]